MNRHERIVPPVLATLCALTFSIAACAERGSSTEQLTNEMNGDLAVAVFAAGCFWCVEEAFDSVRGVVITTSGYIGGHVKNPDYRAVTSGRTGHTEALQVHYDPERIRYEDLLTVFWRNVDATDAGGQFCDRGSQYRSGIFYLNDEQKAAAEASKSALENDPAAPKPIVTEITPAGQFYPAEDYHQDYYQKNPIRYKFYKKACGRAARLEELWGDS